MGLKTTGTYCKECQKKVMAQRNAPNHILHLILSLLTLGFWLPVWLIISIASASNWRCTECGSAVS